MIRLRAMIGLVVVMLACTTLPADAAKRSDAPRTDPESVRIPYVSPPASNDHVVVPGQRMGNLTLGMTAQQVLDILGPPQPIPWTAGVMEYRWPRVSVFLRGSDQRVIELHFSDVAYRIDGGLTFDSTRRQVVATLGRPNLIWHAFDNEVYWYQSGLAMTFTKTDDTINSLYVCANPGVCYQ
jgi:hypothetical protein